jgi:hypothetical protein
MKKPLVVRVSINVDVLFEAGIAMRGSKFHW